MAPKMSLLTNVLIIKMGLAQPIATGSVEYKMGYSKGISWMKFTCIIGSSQLELWLLTVSVQPIDNQLFELFEVDFE